MQNNPLVVERVFNASVPLVWKAITDRNEMKKWYFDLVEFKPEIGFKFEFSGGPDGREYLHKCEITEVIPEKKLVYSWRYDGHAGISYVTFELAEQEGKTLLKLTHEGLGSFPHDNPDFARTNFEGGWDHIINISLKDYLESSETKK